MHDTERLDLLDKFRTEQDIFRKYFFLEKLIREANMRVFAIAKHTGLTSSYLSQLRRVGKVPDMIRDSYYGQLLSASHLIIIARLKNKKQASHYDKTSYKAKLLNKR